MVYWTDFDLSTIQYKTVKSTKKITYINIECAFDIETSSVYVDDGQKMGFMYEWTFGIADSTHICYGRTWDEFLQLLSQVAEYFELSSERVLICYIHNFSFEFQFMRKYFDWVNVFSTDERKPIKALCTLGIEFRDSYILSGYSLEKTAENLQSHKVAKLIGNLDYSLTHTVETELTYNELSYCEHDIIIVLDYINEQISQYGNITRIPLTNTGRVRNYIRKNCYHSSSTHKRDNKRKFSQYRELMQRLTVTSDEYIELKRAFQGGFTHANPLLSGKLLENVTSIDFTSSYPAVMLSEQFPMSKGIKTSVDDIKKMFPDSPDPFSDFCEKYCVVFDAEFTNIQSSIMYESYISSDKCKQCLINPIINNGRVYSADKLVTTITNVDYNIIKNCYHWDKLGVKNIYRYCKGYLPKDIILSILKLYEDKTTLKGVEDKKVEYMNSKGMLNSVYGMCVTDVVRPEYEYCNQGQMWMTSPADIDKQINDYNNSYNRFLFYPWGVWVTAYARRNLWLGIKNIGMDYVYSDTDSIKCLNFDKHKDFVEWYNNLVKDKLYKMCEYYSIDPEKLSPKNIKGESKFIGVWDYEGTYTHFKTLGAKRYMTEENNDIIHITVAGLSKQNGARYMCDTCQGDNEKVFDMFTDELYIPADQTGKMTHTYIDDTVEADITDYQGHTSHVIALSGIHLEDCEFTLSISRQYKTFIDNLCKGYVYKGVKYI